MTVVVIFTCVFEVRAKPILKEIASSQAENMFNNTVENAIVKVIKENNITYSSLVDIEKDNMGRVATVKADTLGINVLKSKISSAVSKEIAEMDSRKISIPLGTIIGISILSGKGPKIKTTVTLSSNSNLTISNKFSSAGINQTLHEIFVNIDATIIVIMPRSKTTTQVSTNFCIAQTVIIGAVPETFAEFKK